MTSLLDLASCCLGLMLDVPARFLHAEAQGHPRHSKEGTELFLCFPAVEKVLTPDRLAVLPVLDLDADRSTAEHGRFARTTAAIAAVASRQARSSRPS
jgi:hypothetical protein